MLFSIEGVAGRGRVGEGGVVCNGCRGGGDCNGCVWGGGGGKEGLRPNEVCV